MTYSTMRNAVLQATVLYVLAMLVDNHMSENMFDKVTSNEGWLDMLAALNTSYSSFTPPKTKPGQLTLDAGNSTNTSLSFNHTAGFNTTTPMKGNFFGRGKPAEPFYARKLPRYTAICVVLNVLQYYWLIWLERRFPARPRKLANAYVREEKIEDSEDREEAVVKKWIAQGRIHRASLNWCNTFLKLVLDMTVGKVMISTADDFLEAVLKFQSPKTVFVDLKKNLAYSLVCTYVSPVPLVTLVSFIIMPAHKQIVFLAGADLVTTIFFNVLFRAFIAWGIKTNFVQSMMEMIGEHAKTMNSDQEYRDKYHRTNKDWRKKGF